MRRNLYDLLSVSPDDDAENLRKAFRKAAKESHPDHHGDDPEAAARFRQITEAYDVLRDAEQRAAYDRLLEVERRPLRSKLKWALSGMKRHMVTDAIIGVLVTIVLAGGYELYSRMSKTAVDEGAGMTAYGSAEIAAVQPAAQSGAAERDRPADAASSQMPIALPIENPVAPGEAASAGQTIEVAKGDRGPDLPVDQAGAKAGPDDPAKNRGNEPQDRHDAQSADVQVTAAETHNGVPGPSSSDVTASANKPDSVTPEPVGASTGIVKQPAETRVSARLHATLKRLPASRARFRHPRWCIDTPWPRNTAKAIHLLFSGADTSLA
jgi:curved DNA-binding protein CbpA